MDLIINLKNFPLLETYFTDQSALKKIRLLCIFGCNASEVIFVTNEDKVFGFGRNRFGGLGLGTDDENLDRPQLNPFLSNKSIANIFCGFEHWIALTVSGRCYSWGHNASGQLGVQDIDQSNAPLIITGLDEQVSDLCCGATHTLALTSSGQVYGWGDNQYGQIGDGSTHNRWIPRGVPFKEPVESIACGRNHSMALTASRLLYVWGLNSYGQLGYCVDNKNSRFISNRPKLITGFEDTLFSKAICGPNYSLVLSSEGYIYSFGENTCGQVGNGSTENQLTPFMVSDIKFKDIIAHKENDISIAVSSDNKFYVWGLANNRRYLSPKELPDSTGKSVFDVYAIYAKKNVTFKTIVVNNELKSWERNYGNNFLSEDSFEEVEDTIKINCDVISLASEVIDNMVSDNDGNGWQQINRLKPKKSKTKKTTLDKVVDIKPFLKNPKIIDDSVIRNIRLIRVFGLYGSKVIFATNDDKVYAFGHNRDLSLGLGTTEEHILQPELVKELCGKQLIDISTGYEHCIGLTTDGQCYGWGQNSFGQLGIGTIVASNKPKLIQELVDIKVVQIACGSYHSLALTSDGELFSWGHNTFAQLGDRTYNSREKPTQVMTPEVIASICCGLNHSVALSPRGRIYVWGGNERGQLGRSPEMDRHESREKPMSNRPHVIKQFENTFVTKAVCGSNHTLVLTDEGNIYAFGENSCGQIGNGSTVNQFTPTKLNKDLKIKDIISHFDNDMSIAVAENDKCYVWGFVQNENVCRPTELANTPGKSLFDIYAKLAKHKVTFKTVVVEEDVHKYVLPQKSSDKPVIKTTKIYSQTTDSDVPISYSKIASNAQNIASDFASVEEKQKTNPSLNDVIGEGVNDDNNNIDRQYYTTTENNVQKQEYVSEFQNNKITVQRSGASGPEKPEIPNYSSDYNYSSVQTTNDELNVCQKKFLKHLRQSFDCRDSYDLLIRSGDNVIYCHKTIIQIRNQKFWQTLKTKINAKNEIIINPNTYQLFYCFLQFLYSIKPEMDPTFVKELKNMARLFQESILEEYCSQMISKTEVIIDQTNVCLLFERSVAKGLAELEKSCIEFAVKNWKSIVKSDEFQAMSDSLSKKLMISVLNSDLY